MNDRSLRSLVRVLDEAVRVPGTNIRIGLDAVVGLVPGLGDVAGAAMAAVVVLAAARAGVPAPVLARMVLNVGIDAVVGAVPVLGDLFDVAWKANSKNLALMDRALERPAETRRASGLVVAGVLALLAGIVVGVGWLAVAVVHAVIAALGQL